MKLGHKNHLRRLSRRHPPVAGHEWQPIYRSTGHLIQWPMALGLSSAGESTPAPALAPTKLEDPAWAYGKLVLGVKNSTICLHCGKKIGGGGITHLKQHLAGVRGQVEPCKKVPGDVQWQMKQLLNVLDEN